MGSTGIPVHFKGIPTESLGIPMASMSIFCYIATAISFLNLIILYFKSYNTILFYSYCCTSLSFCLQSQLLAYTHRLCVCSAL